MAADVIRDLVYNTTHKSPSTKQGTRRGRGQGRTRTQHRDQQQAWNTPNAAPRALETWPCPPPLQTHLRASGVRSEDNLQIYDLTSNNHPFWIPKSSKTWRQDELVHAVIIHLLKSSPLVLIVSSRPFRCCTNQAKASNSRTIEPFEELPNTAMMTW